MGRAALGRAPWNLSGNGAQWHDGRHLPDLPTTWRDPRYHIDRPLHDRLLIRHRICASEHVRDRQPLLSIRSGRLGRGRRVSHASRPLRCPCSSRAVFWAPGGLLRRATAFSANVASLTGIPVRRVQFVVFLLGGAIAGVAGVLASMSIGVSYSSGFALSIIAFSGAVVLGRWPVPLAFAGGLLIGLAIALGQAYLPQGWDAATAPILIVAVLCSGLVSRDIFHG